MAGLPRPHKDKYKTTEAMNEQMLAPMRKLLGHEHSAGSEQAAGQVQSGGGDEQTVHGAQASKL